MSTSASFSNKQVLFVSVSILAMGVVSELLNLQQESIYERSEQGSRIATILFSPINNSGLQTVSSILSFDIGTVANIINILFCGSLAYGVGIYILSKYKYVKVIRFLTSIVLVSSVVSLLYFPFQMTERDPNYIFYVGELWPIEAVKQIMLILFSYRILTFLNKSRILNVDFYETDGQLVYLPDEPRKAVRFLHSIVDTAICVVMILPLFFFKASGYVSELNAQFDEKLIFLVTLALSRLFYYLFFEGFLNATPAKFLTSCRVMGGDSNKAGIIQIFLRTLCRFIPFEPISFLGGAGGWHDRISSTFVVKELDPQED